MELEGITYIGAAIDDPAILDRLPTLLRELLEQINGFVAFDGGLHIRGACQTPEWHALSALWTGEQALHRSYHSLLPSDIPFGQDAVGDQFILRDSEVYRLEMETDTLTPLGFELSAFLSAATDNPLEILGLHPLRQFQEDGGTLNPGELLDVYPPFCTEQAAEGVSLRAVPVAERLYALARIAAAIAPLAEGDRVQFRVID